MEMLCCIRNGLISVHAEAELMVEHEGENVVGGDEAGDAYGRNEEIVKDKAADGDDNQVEASVVGGVMEGNENNGNLQLDDYNDSEDPKYILVDKSDTKDG
ncbi:conserved hypothetical protein [Ricinus communis]|uniref:Uncharacterized protein n=1 Tax=Ricinus communis TaxID=3988 RepID=B9T5Z8_RICCO|nr:conserved hypothetical protein [Ricinus communis]